jgi:hypothetical protein
MDDELNFDELKRFWDDKGEKITLVILFLAAIGSIVCIILGICKWMEGAEALGKDAGNIDKMANLGSYLQGSTGSLWALAGFFVVFLAFLIQAIQFSEQRKQFKIQTDSIARQNFESSFFQMLNLHNEIVLSMTDVDPNKAGADVAATGRECFKRWYREFRGGMWGFKVVRDMDGTEIFEKIPKNNVERYLAFYYEAHQAEFGHYFRNLYHLIKFVNEAEALKNAHPEKEYLGRRRYTSLVRATLSQYELFFLFYNCASPLGSDQFKPLVKKYELLENFNDDDLIKKQEDWEFYKDEKDNKPERGS